jgi:hypothetical protein
MFRLGGNTDQGIMSGVVPRQGYSNGDLVKSAEERKKLLMGLAGQAPDRSMANLLIDFGLNVASAPPTGSIFSTAAGAAKEPFQRYQTAQAKRSAYDQQLGLSAAQSAMDYQDKLAIAKAKAAGDLGYLKKETTEGAYEHFLEENLKSAAKLETWQRPNLAQKFPRQVAEFDSYISRSLRTTDNEQGKEIAANYVDFIPFDQKSGEFDYSKMIAGAYYYDPRYRIFVQRVPDDPDTPKDESGYFQYDNTTFQKSKLSGNQ